MIPDSFAEVYISYSSEIKNYLRTKLSGSYESYQAFKQIWPAYDHIEFTYMFLLNRQNQILGYHQLSKGGITGCVVDVRVIFQLALKANATGVMLAHNHPSGNLEVSSADRKITSQIKSAGEFLDIHLVDHLIISQDGYLSMADAGIM